MELKSQDKIPFLFIGIVSLAVPVLVSSLFLFEEKLDFGDFVYQLPHFHGAINSLTTLVLILALFMIKVGKVQWHKNLMTSAVCMGALFLISYVTYHLSADSALYGDLNMDGALSEEELKDAPRRGTYLIILATHILVSVVALPLILISFFFALKGNFTKHKSFVRFAFPVWLFVSVTGVTVYLMMRPYYCC